MRDDVLKYKSSLTSTTSFAALQRQVKLEIPEDSCKLAVQAYESDDFPFLRATSGNLPFFFMYRCLFEVVGLILSLTAFQCALLEHLNVAPSQLQPNNWAMVRAFEILYHFFNIWPSVPVFLFFFQMKLTGKINWVSLINVSNKLFEFDCGKGRQSYFGVVVGLIGPTGHSVSSLGE